MRVFAVPITRFDVTETMACRVRRLASLARTIWTYISLGAQPLQTLIHVTLSPTQHEGGIQWWHSKHQQHIHQVAAYDINANPSFISTRLEYNTSFLTKLFRPSSFNISTKIAQQLQTIHTMQFTTEISYWEFHLCLQWLWELVLHVVSSYREWEICVLLHVVKLGGGGVVWVGLGFTRILWFCLPRMVMELSSELLRSMISRDE